MQLNQYLELGKLNILRADRLTPHGIFLMAQNGKDVLLPQAYVTEDMTEDSLVEVFLYTDSEDRLIATTLKPKAMLDQFAFLEVVDRAKFGAFLDWGLPKDLLCPTKLQKTPFVVGEKRFVKVVYDEKTHRLVATEKTQDFFKKKPKGLYPKQEVKIIPIQKTDLGYKCIVAGEYEGLIYHNEIFEDITLAQERKGYIKLVRQDGNIDLSLRPIGEKNNSCATDKILDLLDQNNGIMPYNSKSEPELIKKVFGMSKKEFKRSLTQLRESGKIEVKDTGIYKK